MLFHCINKYTKNILTYSFLLLIIFIFIITSSNISNASNNNFVEAANIFKNQQKNFKNNSLLNLSTNEVKVGTYILNVRKLEVTSGTWIVDFYIWFIWNNTNIDPLNFEIMNGSIDFKDEPILETIEVEGKMLKSAIYRIVATLTNDLNFKYYPLDVQMLTIEIENKDFNISKLKYITNPIENNIDTLVKIQGWEIKSHTCEITIHKYQTNFGNEYDTNEEELIYSRYIFGILISRPKFSSMLKLLLPLSIILSLSFLAFSLSPDKLSQRISLGISTVFTSVAFHINLSSAIPQVSYLTLADRLMISCYFILFCSLISTIYITKYVDLNQIDKANKLNKILGIIVPIFGIILITIQFYIF